MLEVIKNNDTWKVVVFEGIYNEYKKDVEDFHKLIIESDNDWDLAIYKSLIAFKNSCDRTTTIYTSFYWASRMRKSFQKLDCIRMFKFQEGE